MSGTPDRCLSHPNSKNVFALTIAVVLFMVIDASVNVYDSAIAGAVYEILWLPSLILSCVLPISAFVLWKTENFVFKSLNLYSIILMLVAVVTIFIAGK
jgi:hypothetical protein